jgi:hypothetical protein
VGLGYAHSPAWLSSPRSEKTPRSAGLLSRVAFRFLLTGSGIALVGLKMLANFTMVGFISL